MPRLQAQDNWGGEGGKLVRYGVMPLEKLSEETRTQNNRLRA